MTDSNSNRDFEDSGDESSFYGFDDEDQDHSRASDGSDVDFGGLASEDDDSSGENDQEDEDGQQEWTDQLTDFQIPDYDLAAEIRFPLPAVPKEIDFFSAFVGDDLWDWLVYQTNFYARQKLTTFPRRLAKFTDVTRHEMKAYFGIRIIMGIVRLPSIALYWSTDDFFGNVGIKKVMTKNRFEEINAFLHFNDSTREPARGTDGFDRLYKVRPVIDYVKGNFLSNFQPSKNISVDEGMIAYKGRVSFRQYMPQKPTKYGIKVWMAADSSNGYILNFNTYLGKEVGQTLTHGLGYRVVTRLVQPFMNKNHHIFFDNFFSSVRLVEHLEAQDTFACGTVRVNRKGIPNAAKTKLKPGEKVVRQKGNLVFTKWHDKRDVCILSTNCSPIEPDFVVQRRGQNVNVSKPAVVGLYNSHMGGVDLNDQLRQYYNIGRSSYKWYKYLFWFLIDVSICNSFILFNHHKVSTGQTKCKQVAFRTLLAKQLIAGFCSDGSGKRKKIDSLSLDPLNAVKHFIVKIKGRKRGCVQCKRKGDKTAKNRAIETTFECLQCGVALCKMECFRDYHQG